MGLLPQSQIDEIADEVYNAVGYTPDIRSVLLSTVNPDFVNLIPGTAMNDKILMVVHVKHLNDRPKLSDGSIPLAAWLERAARLVRAIPRAHEVVQRALAVIEQRNLSASPVRSPYAPAPVVVKKIEKERIVISNDMVAFSFLQAGTKAGNSVGKVIVPRYEDGQPVALPDGSPSLSLGTGWLIGPDLIITNHHVINAREDNEPDASAADFKLQGENATIQFDFNSAHAAGVINEMTTLEASNKDLDFAILRLSIVPAGRDALTIQAETVNIVDDNPQVVNIIQHPQGQFKKVALRNNHIYKSNFPVITYFTDTESGTSGSPVFNDGWRVIALHRASELVGNVSYMGQSTAWVNEGVQMKAIADYLHQHYQQLANELHL